ncbi:hypothetical protein BGZ94_001224 [Podila epigama]|nr:hypothetical protein BGZ94_001224 [Podila epigama]
MSASWSPSPLIPPFRFGTVENEVYRGAYPKQRNLRYLKRLKLKTILSLIPDAPDAVFQKFCEEHNIQSIHLSVDKVKDNVPLTYNRAVEAVQIMIDPDNLPIYVHCLDGASVTGLVVCCLRKLQTWNISSAMGEFLRYLRGGVISSEESVFVEKFASEIEISKPIPPWLWEGQITFKKHPTLKLKITIPPASASLTNTSMHGRGTGDVPSSAVFASNLTFSPSSQGPGNTLSGDAMNNGNYSPGSIGALGRGSSGSSTSSSTGGFGTTSTANPLLKSAIRTDMGITGGYNSRATTISTPTIAAMARNKRAPGASALSAQGSQGGSQSMHQDSNEFDVAGSSSSGHHTASGLGVRLHSGTSSQTIGHNASHGGSRSTIDNNTATSTMSTTGGEGTGSEHSHLHYQQQHRRKESVHVFSKDARNHHQDETDSGTPERSSTLVKNSPAPAQAPAMPPAEAADQYYEVSITLKALALEGADW